MESEKKYTLKGISSELKKLENSKENKLNKIKELTAAIKEDSRRIKELEAIFDRLYNESLRDKVTTAWFKELKLSGESINKYLELSRKCGNTITHLDINLVFRAIELLCDREEIAKDPVAFNFALQDTNSTNPEERRAEHGGNSNADDQRTETLSGVLSPETAAEHGGNDTGSAG